MKHKCDNCDRLATVRLTEITDGKKIEKHLCEECAAGEGITFKANLSVSQLLEDFLQATTDTQTAEIACDVCGLTLSQFRKQALLGCPHDYDAFEPAIAPLLERAQEGATHHAGKVPTRAGNDQKKLNIMLRLRAELKGAVAKEDYEKAAALRDQIKELEKT